MGRILIGAALAATGVAGLLVLSEPVDTYTADIAGTGEQAGSTVEVECADGAALGQFAGQERAESECSLAEDGVLLVHTVKLVVAGVGLAVGVWLLLTGVRAWWRDFWSRRTYRRMTKLLDPRPAD